MTGAGRSVRFDVPLYSVSDAARHIDVPRSTFDTWVRGYANKPKGRSPRIARAATRPHCNGRHRLHV